MKKLLLSLTVLGAMAQPALISADTISLTSGSAIKKSSALLEKTNIMAKLKAARPAIDMALALALAMKLTPIAKVKIDFWNNTASQRPSFIAYLALISLAEHGYSNLKKQIKDNNIKAILSEQLQKLAQKLD